MKSNYIIWHIFHSGVAIYNKKSFTMHIFDYYKDPREIMPDIIYNIKELKNINIYCSHGHQDHYNQEIFQWNLNNYQTNFIMSLDLKDKISNKTKENNNIHFIKNGEELNTNDLHIKAYPSTDLGISIHVKEGDSTIFHGGDLNWWDWNSFNKEEKLKEENDFKNAVNKIKKENIEIACIALDPRLDDSFHLGLAYFNSIVKPKYIVPLHFKSDYDVIRRYNNLKKENNILPFSEAGDKISIIE